MRGGRGNDAEGRDLLRFAHQGRWARLGAGLSVTCLMLLGAPARGQDARVGPDLFSPRLDGDQRNPPRFERREPAAAAARPRGLTPIPSGAGVTGFDSSNARKAARPKRTARAAPAARAAMAAAGAAEEKASPYQTPIPPLETPAPARGPVLGSASALPPVPGAPPVDLGPIRRPPKKRNAHPDEPDDPYAPLGVRIGAFDLYPAVELIGGYNTNPAAVPGGGAAWLYAVSPELLVNSNWSRHEFKAELRGSYTGYQPAATPSLSRPYFNGKAAGRIDVTRDTNIGIEARTLVATDNPGSPNLPAGLARLPVYTTIGGAFGVTQRFNRFALTLKGDAERTQYEASKLTDGSTVSNDDRNYDQVTGTLRGSYEWATGVKPFVDASLDSRRHDREFDSSGFARNSNGVTLKGGVTFELARRLTGEIALGFTRRTYEDARLEPLEGLIGDASLIFTASALTTVKLTGTSTTGESTIPGVSGVLYRDVGLQVDHAFRRWLIASLKLGFGVDDYIGLDRLDRRYSAGLGLTYKLDRTVQLKGEFRQDWLRSSVPGNDYTASTFLVGLRFQR